MFLQHWIAVENNSVVLVNFYCIRIGLVMSLRKSLKGLKKKKVSLYILEDSVLLRRLLSSSLLRL